MHTFLMAWFLLYSLVAPAAAAAPVGSTERSTERASELGFLASAPDIAFKDAKSSEEKEQAMSASEKEAERKRKDKLARVIVLKWPDNKSVDYADTTIQRNVKSRIARPDAQFFPEVDLYQNGRKVKDRTVVPAMQPAAVPDQNLQRVRAAVDSIAGVPWNGLQPQQWGLKAQELRDMVELIWFVDKVEQREPLFLLYTQIGRSAENQNQNVPPFYEQIGDQAVNYYFYLAAILAYQDPALMSKLTDQELNGYIAYILQQLQQGAYPSLKVDFEQEGEEFKLETFSESYEVHLNGIKTDPNEQGQLEIFLGRTDIYLKRADSGHGLSERLEVSKLEDKIYFVRDTARKKMGTDFIEQLFLHPNECTPALDGDILNYLSIYAKIHEKSEIYITVPQYGNANRVWVWRYDRPSANLQLVNGGADGFPVRFGIVLSGGVLYNDAHVEVDPDFIEDQARAQGSAPGDFASPEEGAEADLNPSYVPVNFELRGHYNRLMVVFGAELGMNSEPEAAPWVERYYTPGHLKADVANLEFDEGQDEFTAQEFFLNTVDINRDLYMGASAVLGRDAGVGLGPRIGARIGWTNVPYALQTTAHVGMALAAPGVEPLGDRVRPFVDVDLRAGLAWPFASSLAHTSTVTVAPVFGITAGVGTTF